MSRPAQAGGLWPDYRTVWRWHFYAGVLCIPFILWLATTGSIYLFRPQIEGWLDRPYDHLTMSGPLQPPSAQVRAALAAAPGTTLRAYELPQSPTSAARVIVSHGTKQVRVYVRPDTLQVLKTVNEDDRFMRVIFRLHGELLAGDRGSNLVELAACWAIVMLITGLFLWWPRNASGPAGVVWPRLGGGSRQFWRDLHAVTGVWVSLFAIFLLLTGLPWAKNWGGYLKQVRALSGAASAPMDWTNGRAAELAQRRAQDAGTRDALSDEHAEHGGMSGMSGMSMEGMSMGAMAMPDMAASENRYAPLDRMVPTVAALRLPPPVSISPPTRRHGGWTAKSDTANRPQRVDLKLDASTGAVTQRTNFNQRPWIDQAVGFGVAAHEGQLFGPLNQALGVFTASGLVTIAVSAAVMWWRRRPQGQLGAPPALAERRVGLGLLAITVLLAIYLPLLGVSLIAILAIEQLVLRRISPLARWLGLRPAQGRG